VVALGRDVGALPVQQHFHLLSSFIPRLNTLVIFHVFKKRWQLYTAL
jgi:hypothetical protein